MKRIHGRLENEMTPGSKAGGLNTEQPEVTGGVRGPDIT